MKSLLASVALVAAIMASAVSGNTLPLQLMSADKTYIMGGDSDNGSSDWTFTQTYDTNSGGTMEPSGYLLYKVGGGVQGYQPITTAGQTQSLQSWSWNSTFPLQGGIDSITTTTMSTALSGQFFFQGKSYTVTGTSTTVYPIGVASRKTGEIAWMKLLTCNPGSIAPLNSTHFYGNIYGNCASVAKLRMVSTILLGTAAGGAIVNFTSVPDYVNDLSAANWWVSSYGGQNRIMAYTSDKNSVTKNYLFVWPATTNDIGSAAQAGFMYGVMNLTDGTNNANDYTPAMGCEVSSAWVLFMSNKVTFILKDSNGQLPTTLNNQLKAAAVAASETLPSSSSDQLSCSGSSSSAKVYFLTAGGVFGRLALTQSGSTNTLNTNVWNLDGTWANFMTSGLLSFSPGSGKLILGKTGNTYYYFDNIDTNTKPSTPYSNFVQNSDKTVTGVDLQVKSCMQGGSNLFFCLSQTATGKYPMIVAVQTSSSSPYVSQSLVYQSADSYLDSTRWFATSSYNGGFPVLVEGGFISELGAGVDTVASYSSPDFFGDASPTATERANTITFSNASYMWTFTTTDSGNTGMSGAGVYWKWDATFISVKQILGGTDQYNWVHLNTNKATSDGMPMNTDYVCAIPTNDNKYSNNAYDNSNPKILNITAQTQAEANPLCYVPKEFGACGSATVGATIGGSWKLSFDNVKIVDGKLYYTANGCIFQLAGPGQVAAVAITSFYQQKSTASTKLTTPEATATQSCDGATPSTFVSVSDRAKCGTNYYYATIKAGSLYGKLKGGNDNNIYVTLAKNTSSSTVTVPKIFSEFDWVVSVDINQFTVGKVYRGGAPQLFSCTKGGDTTNYWQLSPSDSGVTEYPAIGTSLSTEAITCEGTFSKTMNAQSVAQLPTGSTSWTQWYPDLVWYQGYWYMGGLYNTQARLLCFNPSDDQKPVWYANLHAESTVTVGSITGIFSEFDMIYVETGNYLYGFSAQQAGSAIPNQVFSIINQQNLFDKGVDGRFLTHTTNYVSGFSFLGRPMWETPACATGAGNSGGKGVVSSAPGPFPIGSKAVLTCCESSSTTTCAKSNTMNLLDRTTGHITNRVNFNQGLTLTYLSKNANFQYYYLKVIGTNAGKPNEPNRHAIMSIKHTSTVQPINPAYTPQDTPSIPTTPVSGLGIEHWNTSYNGNEVEEFSTGFGNLYACNEAGSGGGARGGYASAYSSYDGTLLWNTSLNGTSRSCDDIRSLGPLVYVRVNEIVFVLNAMTGRALYAPIDLGKVYGASNFFIANNATLFFTNSDKSALYYFSISSGAVYTILDLSKTAAWVEESFVTSAATTVANTSAMVIATQNYVFWVTAFGEVRHFAIDNDKAYGSPDAINVHPNSNWAVLIRTGYWKEDYPMFPSVTTANVSTAVLLEWSTTSVKWYGNAVANQFAQPRKNWNHGYQYYIDFGAVSGTPVVLLLNKEWIQALYLNGAKAGQQAYGPNGQQLPDAAATSAIASPRGVRFWWLKLSPLYPVLDNVWYLSDNRANFHVFLVDSGKFNTSFQLQSSEKPDGQMFNNIYAPQYFYNSARYAVNSYTSKNLYVVFNQKNDANKDGNGNMWVYRISRAMDAKTPTEAFMSVYPTRGPNGGRGWVDVVRARDGTETAVVANKYQFAAVSFMTGETVYNFPEGQTIASSSSWAHSDDLSKQYTATRNGFAQGFSVKNGKGDWTWNVSLGLPGDNTYGVTGYLSKDNSRYFLVTNNGSVCAFNADVSSKSGPGGQGFFGTDKTKAVCQQVLTTTTEMGKKCTFTNRMTPLNAFFVETNGYVYFSSATSNCLFQLQISNPSAIKAVTMLYSFAKTPIGDGGNLYFADGVYVYKLNQNQFLATVGEGVAQKTLATGATAPALDSGNIYVGTTEGLTSINANSMKLQWTTSTKSRVVRTPVIIQGRILVGTNQGNIYAISQSGNVLWTDKPGGQVISTLSSGATGTFLWITTEGIVAYDIFGMKAWSDFTDVNARFLASPKNSFSIGRVFPVTENCQFRVTNDGKTMYARCNTMLAARDIRTGQILYRTGMPGTRFAISGTQLNYPGTTKLVQQNVVLPPLATFPPGYMPPTPNPTTLWTYSVILALQTFDQKKWVDTLASALMVKPETISVLSLRRQYEGLAVVQIQLVGEDGEKANMALNKNTNLASVGIQSFSAVDTAEIHPSGPPVVNIAKKNGAQVGLLVVIMLIAIVATIVLVVMMTKLTPKSTGGSGELNAGLMGNESGSNGERSGDIKNGKV